MKYYAIVSGRKTGIYTDWSIVQKLVNGFPGAIFKSFHNKHDAESFMNKSTLSSRQTSPTRSGASSTFADSPNPRNF